MDDVTASASLDAKSIERSKQVWHLNLIFWGEFSGEGVAMG